MIEMKDDRLVVSFPELHPDARCAVSFQRTLRIPDDNQEYPLPAGLGRFPLLAVEDFDVPAAWKKRGGVFLPMYQSEAMWLKFDASGYPFAVKVAAGKINALTGEAWRNGLSVKPQDYVTLPGQAWLDGFSAEKDVVRQFVAAPLGEGYTAEEQITGEAVWGGLQLIFYPMKLARYREILAERKRRAELTACNLDIPMFCRAEHSPRLGLGPGGRIRQEIARDRFGIRAWDTSLSSRCFVHLANSQSYQAITGHAPPTEPVTAEQYADAGMPWFDYYQNGDVQGGSAVLAGLDGLAAAMLKKGNKLQDNAPIKVGPTIDLSMRGGIVRDGEF